MFREEQHSNVEMKTSRQNRSWKYINSAILQSGTAAMEARGEKKYGEVLLALLCSWKRTAQSPEEEETLLSQQQIMPLRIMQVICYIYLYGILC